MVTHTSSCTDWTLVRTEGDESVHIRRHLRGVIGEYHFDSAILLSASGIVIAGHREGFTLADGRDLIGTHASFEQGRLYRRGATFGSIVWAFDTGIGTGSLVLGWMAEHFGFRDAFLVGAAVSLGSIPIFIATSRLLPNETSLAREG